MNQSLNLLKYTLHLADNALILGHRLSEWCGHGPVLEQDIALTNISLDHLGRARSLYQYAAEQFNSMPDEAKQAAFVSPLLQQVSGPADEDDMAYLRDAWDFRNVLLAEQPNGDWAHTVARSFFMDTFNYFYFTALERSADQTLAAIAGKSLKEVAYHMRWSSEWVIRLGDGTEESHRRMQAALEAFWPYTGELFLPSEAEAALEASGVVVPLNAIREQWHQRIAPVLEEATLSPLPADAWMHQGGKEGTHSEHLGYVLAELQFMQRAYPNMEW
jgi:ring-1,2-phenylacetyl-CoA epoxidase subunit PaaC